MKKILCILSLMLVTMLSSTVFAFNGEPDYITIRNFDNDWAGQGYVVHIFLLETEGVEMTDVVVEIEGLDDLHFEGPVGASKAERSAPQPL